MFREDQRVRQPTPLSNEERLTITRTDDDRLALVKQMIAEGELHTANDFRRAGFIMQHSHEGSDYLVAHTLAVACAAEGDKSCEWLAAATLDRYLQSIQRPQIYGTQFVRSNSDFTQQPYTPEIISDSLRTELGVPSFQAQQEQLRQMNSSR